MKRVSICTVAFIYFYRAPDVEMRLLLRQALLHPKEAFLHSSTAYSNVTKAFDGVKKASGARTQAFSF